MILFTSTIIQDMMDYMNLIVTMNQELNSEERNLLSVAFKNSVGSKRASWRILTSLMEKQEFTNGNSYQMIKNYRNKISCELHDICDHILTLLDHILIPQSPSPTESRVFYLKMKGDYLRYSAEFTQEDVTRRKELSDLALQAYESSSNEMVHTFTPTHPIRLGMALSYSVFYYEVLGQHERACEVARRAFDDAIADLEMLTEENYKDSTIIMSLLRDNLTLWTQGEERS